MGTPVHELGEVRLGVECCVLSQGKVLLQKRNSTAMFFPNYFCYPGGHVDDGEDIKQAIIREVKEEAGITLPEDKVKLIYQEINNHVDNKKIWVIFTFKCEIPEPVAPISQESEGLCEWVDLDKVNLNTMVPPVAKHFNYVVNNDELRFSVGVHRKDDVKSAQ